MLSVLWARSQFTLTASAFCLFAYNPSVLSLQWLEAGLGFPAGGKSTKSWPLHQRSVTRALALRLCRKEFPQRQKAVKPMKYLLRRKRVQNVWKDTWAGSDRDSRWVTPSWQSELLVWGISYGFPSQSFGFAWFTVHIWYIWIRPCVPTHLLAKMDPAKEAHG